MNKFGTLLMALILCACTPRVEQAQKVDKLPAIYPDYTVTIPANIAPLNFFFPDQQVEAVSVTLTCGTDSYTKTARGEKVIFDLSVWKNWTTQHAGQVTEVQVYAKREGKWLQYNTFRWNIVADKIDTYLTYRLIEPGYEVWNNLQIEERNIENFETKILADNQLMKGQCMNCHIHGGDQGQYSFFYVRGEGGGTLLNRDGKLSKVTLKNAQMKGATVYGDFHPSGRYGVYSTNVIMPSFHNKDARRLEVYDTTSDLCIADFEQNRMILSPLTADSTKLETFPTFSADGKQIYYCGAEVQDSLPAHVKDLHYSLCRVDFHAETGEWGTQVDTLWNARTEGGSANFPKASPDGRYLLFTRSDYGTFPIWHKEADLYLMDLKTGEVQNLMEANSDKSDTYHTWSHNSRWIAFASKRGDGQYGRVYFAYLDQDGQVHKAFVLPQKNPEKDMLNLKSYNIPDLSTVSMPYDAQSLVKLMDQSAKPFN